jgi:myo-inositol-1(or 4)-monophosphatase
LPDAGPADGGAGMTDVEELLELAITIARATGELLTDERPDDMTVGTKSTPTDVVTEMDTRAEQLIARMLHNARPGDRLLGEEGTQAAESTAPTTGVRWIVDPIDGTVNYLYRLPQWAVSIAAEVDGVIEAGVVFDPSKGELFTAVRGGGAFLNGRRIATTRCTTLAQAMVATGFGYDASRRARQAVVLTHVLPVVRDIRRLGAASLDLCSVACGRVDAYFERGLNFWDHAAGALVAAEAGAQVEGLHGQPASDSILVAAPPALFPALHDLVAAIGADHD